MLVDMNLVEIAIANQYGLMRQLANEGKNDKSYYDRRLMESDRVAQPAAILCEMAVAKLLNIYYVPTLWHSDQHQEKKFDADVGLDIEVRRSRKKGVGPAIRPTDRGKILFGCFIPCEEWRQVDVLGFVVIPPEAKREDYNEWFEPQGNGDYWRCSPQNLTEATKENYESYRNILLTN